MLMLCLLCSPVYGDMCFTRGRYKFSFINAVNIGGVKAFGIYFGSVNEERFIEFFIDELVPLLRPYPQPNSIVLLDNVKFHKNGVVKHILDEIGCILIWIPRYMPLYNLAEYSFRDTKAIEKAKGITGEYESMMSLVDSIESLQNKNYEIEMKRIGYI